MTIVEELVEALEGLMAAKAATDEFPESAADARQHDEARETVVRIFERVLE